MPYVTGETAAFDGQLAHVLRDETGAEAWVVPAVGANCIAFQTAVNGETAHVLSTPPSMEVLRERPTYWGCPILAPYPGRHQTPFIWKGNSYLIEANDRPGIALHGFVAGAPWQVVGATATSLTCRFDSEATTGRAERWPWPFTLTVTHSLQGGALRIELTLLNRAGEEVPHLLGLHPYFPIRLTPALGHLEGRLPTAAELVGSEPKAARSDSAAWIAADELWEMRAGVATGVTRRLEGAWDLRTPKSIAQLEDSLPPLPPRPGQSPATAIFGDDTRSDPRLPVLLYGKRAALRSVDAGTDPSEIGGVYSGLRDLASGVEVLLESSAAFGALALFCPPAEPRVALEPRSAVSDALTLMNDARGLATGVWPLSPGASWTAWARVSAQPLPR
jgi:galactose mutarotase-like enzyme